MKDSESLDAFLKLEPFYINGLEQNIEHYKSGNFNKVITKQSYLLKFINHRLAKEDLAKAPLSPKGVCSGLTVLFYVYCMQGMMGEFEDLLVRLATDQLTNDELELFYKTLRPIHNPYEFKKKYTQYNDDRLLNSLRKTHLGDSLFSDKFKRTAGDNDRFITSVNFNFMLSNKEKEGLLSELLEKAKKTTPCFFKLSNDGHAVGLYMDRTGGLTFFDSNQKVIKVNSVSHLMGLLEKSLNFNPKTFGTAYHYMKVKKIQFLSFKDKKTRKKEMLAIRNAMPEENGLLYSKILNKRKRWVSSIPELHSYTKNDGKFNEMEAILHSPIDLKTLKSICKNYPEFKSELEKTTLRNRILSVHNDDVLEYILLSSKAQVSDNNIFFIAKYRPKHLHLILNKKPIDEATLNLGFNDFLKSVAGPTSSPEDIYVKTLSVFLDAFKEKGIRVASLTPILKLIEKSLFSDYSILTLLYNEQYKKEYESILPPFDANTKICDGFFTPLNYVLLDGNFKSAIFLMQNGADINQSFISNPSGDREVKLRNSELVIRQVQNSLNSLLDKGSNEYEYMVDFLILFLETKPELNKDSTTYLLSLDCAKINEALLGKENSTAPQSHIENAVSKKSRIK